MTWVLKLASLLCEVLDRQMRQKMPHLSCLMPQTYQQKHLPANDFLDMDMWLRLYILMKYALEFDIIQHNWLIVNDIELGKIHIHVYPTVSPSRNLCCIGVDIYKHNGMKYLQIMIIFKSYFLVCSGIWLYNRVKVYILSVILTITRSNCESS
jgi:hypothetical protein